jgi:hypothetical protein
MSLSNSQWQFDSATGYKKWKGYIMYLCKVCEQETMIPFSGGSCCCNCGAHYGSGEFFYPNTLAERTSRFKKEFKEFGSVLLDEIEDAWVIKMMRINKK